MPEREPQISLLDKHISRRDLLKGAVILTGGAILTEACGGGIKEFPKTTETKYPLVWQTNLDNATIFQIRSSEGIEVILSYDDKHFEKSIRDPLSGNEIAKSQVPGKEVWEVGGLIWVPELEEIKIPGIFNVGVDRDSWNVPEGYIYPAIYNDVVIASSTENEGKDVDYEYYAGFDIESGEMLWKRKFGFNGGFYFNETGFYEISGENVKFGDSKLNILIRRIDLHTGKQYWKKDNITKSEVAIPFWADSNNLIVVSNNEVISFNTQSGEIFGKLKFDRRLFTVDPFTAIHEYFEDFKAAVGPQQVFLPIVGRLIELEKTSGGLSYVNVLRGPVDQAQLSNSLLIIASGRELYAYNIAG